VNDGLVCAALADQGSAWGTRSSRSSLSRSRRRGAGVCSSRLRQPFPGLCLYYPTRSQHSAALRSFVEMVRKHRAEAIAGQDESAFALSAVSLRDCPERFDGACSSAS